MRRLFLFSLVLFVAACTEVTGDAVGSSSVPDGDRALVVHVSDGDSLIVEFEGIEHRVRLIGINAPERDECFGSEAWARLEAMVLDQQVTLVKDVETEDQYGRMLRYVYLDGSLINADLVKDGFAMARSYEPNTSARASLSAAESEARRDRLGLWAEGACAVSASVRIDHIEADAPGPDDENLNGEWLELVNEGDSRVELSSWSIRDAESVNRFSIPDGAGLDAGQSLRIYTGCGDDSPADLFWCSATPVWNNRGDVGYLLDPEGKIADRSDY